MCNGFRESGNLCTSADVIRAPMGKRWSGAETFAHLVYMYDKTIHIHPNLVGYVSLSSYFIFVNINKFWHLSEKIAPANLLIRN